ncbi:uncharacterized protein [Haliotis cracherodii]|uniref:uncharacterized protein n=1 Tax=Haliotis cracherodii TaxID=6455 RepID=UPI0039E834CA
MAASNSAIRLLLGLILLALTQESACILCRTKTSGVGLAHRDHIQCANSCCGPDDDQYCCVVSNAVILGCAVGGGTMVVITIGAICYFLSRGRRCCDWGNHVQRSSSISEPHPFSRVSSVGSELQQIDRIILECSVRRPSQLSLASLPSGVYHIHDEQISKTSTTGAVAPATVPDVHSGNPMHR